MSAVPVIAVFDIGKTNKKCFLIDEQYRIVLERVAQFEEMYDEDGDACENLAKLTIFIKQVFDELMSLPEYDIRAVNFSAYGASFVHLDKNGKPVTPLYNYLKPYPEELKTKFYQAYGGEENFSVQTASPVLGSLNSGMQLYRLKELSKNVFDQIAYSLHLPQYTSYLFTGKYCTDITSIGCHTNLWDFTKNEYHGWVVKENIFSKLPALFPCTDVMDATINGKVLKVGVGFHDSSAALIPYLSAFAEPFMLISTGTWCISLNPFNTKPLTVEELKQDCLCYLAYDGRPVKASRLFAGHEHEVQVKNLSEKFNTDPNSYKEIVFNPEIDIVSLSSINNCNSFEEAYHVMMLNIIQQQKHSSSLVMGDVKRIFVDGGFANNSVYMHLLAAAFPDHEVYAASVSQATAMGAALVIHSKWNSKPIPGSMVELNFFSTQRSI